MSDQPRSTGYWDCERSDGFGIRECDCRETCSTCEGSGEVFVRRDSRGRVDYIDGSPTSETTRCDMCQGEGVRQ